MLALDEVAALRGNTHVIKTELCNFFVFVENIAIQRCLENRKYIVILINWLNLTSSK